MATISWEAVGGLTGVVLVAVTVGGMVGRAALGQWKTREQHHSDEQKRREDDRALRLALTGTPATAFADRVPGLLEITRDLQKGHKETIKAVADLQKSSAEMQKEMVEHRREDAEIAKQLDEHLRGHA